MSVYSFLDVTFAGVRPMMGLTSIFCTGTAPTPSGSKHEQGGMVGTVAVPRRARTTLPFVVIASWFSSDARRILPLHNRWLCSATLGLVDVDVFWMNAGHAIFGAYKR